MKEAASSVIFGFLVLILNSELKLIQKYTQEHNFLYKEISIALSVRLSHIFMLILKIGDNSIGKCKAIIYKSHWRANQVLRKHLRWEDRQDV